ncbi:MULTISPECIES: NO-inducible flavohemoprotein [Agrobacterium]|uniref:nitric oxide dioxygenase n=1 Tax=Agrobacterium pusense TaxID=648995 RepID=A0AA44EFI1_9HYPH|nr:MULTISPECIES: NO-inducible flavohemoprotein [Agrobacterium]KNY30633.1 dihydropteridine reductase [Agrobacterium sp. SUL3]NRF07176.1 NO-inducible flavohemoprotein [Agrobacterium pusense]NRF17729.1 NO-inducible flavohemoprotein [Agrobacterium pusense]
MPAPLSEKTILIVKASAPALAVHGTAITKAMYARLFEDAHIKELFNHSNQGEGGSQIHALAAAIVAYAQNIDNLAPVVPVVERIAQKHIGYNILPEHYPYVATALLSAIKAVLGDAATPELIEAWAEAYWFLADLLKEREAVIRDGLNAEQGGWQGWRPFVIAEKIGESSVITTFILRPADGGYVVKHKPGQYLTLRLFLVDGSQVKRNYSISCSPNNDYYRISVKREESGAGGSRFLHDIAQVGNIIEATPPAGDFFLPEQPVRPVILVSAGVGLTPMVSMIETIGAEYPDVQAYYVHAALNSSTHAMDRHVRSIAKEHGRISVATFYSEPAATDTAGETHDYDGFISLDWLKHNTPFTTGDFYLCGPRPFLKSLVNGLWMAGVNADRIHFEFFGPADEQLAA